MILSVGHIFQRMRAVHFLDELKREWDKYKEKGRIKEDYEFTEDRISDAHPIRVAATRTTIYDRDTGAVIARIEPGYEFYWCHWHAHVCPEGWKGEVE